MNRAATANWKCWPKRLKHANSISRTLQSIHSFTIHIFITTTVWAMDGMPIGLFCLVLSNPMILGGILMLSIEYVHKRARLFRVELSLAVLAGLLVIFFIWQILRVLLVIKWRHWIEALLMEHYIFLFLFVVWIVFIFSWSLATACVGFWLNASIGLIGVPL